MLALKLPPFLFLYTQSFSSFSFCEGNSKFQSTGIESNHNWNIYPSAAQNELHRALNYQLSSLINNKYKENNGIHARLINGPKGIGKSTVIKTFLAQQDDAIPLYLSYDDLFHTDNILQTNSILQLIESCLVKHGIYSDPTASKNMGVRLAMALEAHDKHLFLVVDEIEQLYRVSNEHDQSLYITARCNLGDLAWLGNQKSGRFAVFLCSSSASAPLLITCKADRKEFPLLHGAPSLNEQKYRTLFLHKS